MKYSLLGRSGVRVSRVCIGTYPYGVAPLAKDVDRLMGRALDLGINFIDTSNSYGNQARFDRQGAPPAAERASSEEMVGKALKGRRNEVVLASKVQEWMYDGPNGGGPEGGGLSRVHMMEQVEQTLSRLGTDHLDVYHAHHPDPTTPLDVTLRTFDDLVRQGKVRYCAISNFPAWQLAEAAMLAEHLGLDAPVANQINYNLINREVEAETVPAAQRFGLSLTVFGPLGGGLLTGMGVMQKQSRYMQSLYGTQRRYSPEQLAVAEKMDTLGAEWGHPPAQLALAWLLSRPTVAAAITGPETVEELEQNAAAVDIELSDDQMAALSEVGLGVKPTM